MTTNSDVCSLPSPPFTHQITSLPTFTCDICKKVFKSQQGVKLHQSIIRRYNEGPTDLDTLPEKTVKDFKQILVYWIHRRLPKTYKNQGKQLVSVPCTESLFFAVFRNYIHARRKGSYTCIFKGHDSYQVVSNLLENEYWGKKIYGQQRTYIVLGEQLYLKINPLAHLATSSQKKNQKVRQVK